MFARTAKLLTLECPHAVRAPVGKGSCRFISGASKRPERGKSPDARRGARFISRRRCRVGWP